MKLNSRQIENELNDTLNLPYHTSDGHIELSKNCSNVKEIHYKEGRSYHNVYGRIERFIHKNVNRPYNVVFSEFKEMVESDKSLLKFCRKWGESLTTIFNNHIDMGGYSTKYTHRKDHFYLDENGIIRNAFKDMPTHHKDKIFIETDTTYRWPNELHVFTLDLISILTLYLNYTSLDAKHIATETITQKELNELKNRYFKSYKAPYEWNKLRKNISNYCREKKYFHVYSSIYGGIFDAFKKIVDGYYITRTKEQRIKNRAESLDKQNKIRREVKKNSKEQNETLLHDLTEKKRLLERKENLIKIQAHGMSETESFRGEEYHGEKRKKNIK